ncbi:MAG: hypothetical protein OEV42_19755 [Deltaproteobacteria bacterium]|nr:hypothetical protein [Deltaproteobacteria bacterium]
MKTLILVLVGVLLMSGSAWGVSGLSEPHYDNRGVSCSSCHGLVVNMGPRGTRKQTNFELCRDCHNQGSSFAGALYFDSRFSNYTVGISGAFHKWDVYTSNSRFGASAPSHSEMMRVINDYGEGKITCSVCHNQHGGSEEVRRAGRLRKKAVEEVKPGGTGTIEYEVLPGAYAKGWYVEIVGGGSETTATYKVSFGKARSTYWMGWNTGDELWESIGLSGPRQANYTSDNQFIDNEKTVKITFRAGTYTAGQRWRFYYGYPLLRALPDTGDNVTGKRFCRDCHSQRAQTHYRDGNVWDGKMKSHPVGVPLNANGGGYDRKPLDVDGRQQASSFDNNSTNDLLLFGDYTAMLTTFGNLTSGDVQCLTCHAPHWTDSNSQTVDLR